MTAPLLLTYHAVTALLAPLAPLALAWRQRRGKEHAQRIGERLGVAGHARPQGPLAWLHGASVGESLALLPIVERLVARGLAVLVTTGTVTSADILERRLPAGALHQFVPLDVPAFWRRFLDHWRPDILLLAESELWPNMLRIVHGRAIPLVLVNARMSDRSFARWSKLPRLAAALFSQIDMCLAQSDADAVRLARLGARDIRVPGNLKYDGPAPPADPAELARLVAAVGPRPVWVAASTHPGEEESILAVHAGLRAAFPALLTIIVPRHAHRGDAVDALAAAAGLTSALRSRHEPIVSETHVYVADTMGELGLFYRLSAIVFVGRSLAPADGGQNPIEPAKLNVAILHGTNVGNFRDVYRILDAAGGAAAVADADALRDGVAGLLADGAGLRRMARAARDAVAKLGGATDGILTALDPVLRDIAARQDCG